jgi:hypothetical protein
VPPEDYFTLGTAVRILGARGIRKLTTATTIRKITAIVGAARQ